MLSYQSMVLESGRKLTSCREWVIVTGVKTPRGSVLQVILRLLGIASIESNNKIVYLVQKSEKNRDSSKFNLFKAPIPKYISKSLYV